MKRILTILIIIAVGISVFDFYQKSKIKIADFSEFNKNGIIQEIKDQVKLSGTLRSKVSAPNSYLTYGGVLENTNKQRQQNNLAPLRANSKLDQAAMAKVKDMFKNQYFEHISPSGAGPADLAEAAGYGYIAIGENLALGNYKNDEDLVAAWMNSPGHRANILNEKYEEIGVAVLKGEFEGKQTWLAVQEFGRPESDCPKVDLSLKNQINAETTEMDILEVQIKSLKSILESSSPKTKPEIEEYNQNVRQYNDLIRIYNNKIDVVKIIQTRYNDYVKAYNECLAR
jgi:hypothetical protein